MIRFFRRIRQNLLNHQKFSKYLLYAVGEILLVVIGILIALQVDNWNEARKLREEERVVANEIYLELKENRAYLKETLEDWTRRHAHIVALKDTLYTENLQLSQRTFDSLLLGTLVYSNFSPFRKKLDRILAADNFALRESRALAGEIMDLAGLYDALEVYFQYNADTWRGIVQPYLISHYSFRYINNALRGTREVRQVPKIDHKPLLADPVFDNIVNNMEGDVRPFIQRLKITLSQLEEVLALLESSYPGLDAAEPADGQSPIPSAD